MSIAKKAAGTACALAIFSTPFVFAQIAPAEPLNGGCSGGTVTFNTTPLGLMPTHVNGTLDGNFAGCAGTPSSSAALHGNFTGDNANCFAIPAFVNGTITWANGEVSEFAGPFFVPGGITAAPPVNTVAIVNGPGAGGQLAVDQGPVDGVRQIGPCIAGTTRQGLLPINGLRFH
jgi:hypothetical protein